MPKRFTLDEAQRMIPRVEPLLRAAIGLKAEYTRAETDFENLRGRAAAMGGVVLDRGRMTEAKQRRETAAVRLRAAIEEISETGCLIKDLDRGLIDFPTLYHGTEVYLCWLLGEEGIQFWHPVEAGFRGRKAIDQEFIDNHEGDRPH
jgi:hypothetical protein